MNGLQGDVESSLSEVRRLTATDFAALAWTDHNDRNVRWKYASGNRNDRYKRIVLRIGRGFAGRVMQNGRPIVVESFSNASGMDLCDNTLVLAEGLKSIICVPLSNNDRVMGVLLIGHRSIRHFESNDIELTVNLAEQLMEILLKIQDRNTKFSKPPFVNYPSSSRVRDKEISNREGEAGHGLA